MKVILCKSVTQIDAKQWNSIVGKNRLICRHEYLRAVEQSNINDCDYFYPVVFSGTEIVAHTCLYFISTELDSFAQGPLRGVSDSIRRMWPGFLKLRSIECGTPVALGHTISLRQDCAGDEALSLIVQETEQLAKRMGVGIVLFRDFEKENWHDFSGLQECGYSIIHNLPSASLSVRWKCFEDYLQSMRSHYRYRIQRNIKQLAMAKGVIEEIDDFSGCSIVLERLWKNVYDQAHEYRRERLHADFFDNLNHHLGSRVSVLMVRIDDEPAGFSLLLHDDETLIQLFCGLDYRYNQKYAVYFNMLYKVAEMSIDRGFKKVDYGITTLIPKQDIGATVDPLRMYMKALNPLGNLVIPKLFRAFTPTSIPRQRNVFKA